METPEGSPSRVLVRLPLNSSHSLGNQIEWKRVFPISPADETVFLLPTRWEIKLNGNTKGMKSPLASILPLPTRWEIKLNGNIILTWGKTSIADTRGNLDNFAAFNV